MSRRLRDVVGHSLAGVLGPPLVRALAASCRVVVDGEERLAEARARGGVLLALWHGRLLPVVVTHKDRGLVALVSEHRDGEYIGRILERVGFRIVRGSTTRGGARALFEMAAHARQGRDLAITPDGPHGPRLLVRPGAVAIAQRAGVAIVPLGAAASRAWVLRTWDGFYIPRPWSRLAIVYGPPLSPPSEAGDDAAATRARLGEMIEEATREADRLAAAGTSSRKGDARTFVTRDDERHTRPASAAPALSAYRAVTGALYALLWPGLRALAAARPDPWAGRMGRVDRMPARGVWLHAASVGELAGATPLVEGIRRRSPACPIVVSTMTATGLRLARDGALPIDGAFPVPFDFPRAAARSFDLLSPRALILMETELWPNILFEATRRRVPLAIVNARISDRSARRYRRLRPLLEGALASAAWIGAQTERDRERFLALGARPSAVEVVGSSKEDARAGDGDRASIRSALRIEPEDALLVFGSVRTAEDAVFLPVIARLLSRNPSTRVLYAPRHVDRVRALAARIAQAGLAARTLTAWRLEPGGERIILLDTMGELAALYGAADVAVIGGSFSPHGGHNPLEAARWGIPVVMGPRRENVREVFDRLAAAGGAEEASDEEGLERALARLVGDREERGRRGRAARSAVEARASVTERVLDALVLRGVIEDSR